MSNPKFRSYRAAYEDICHTIEIVCPPSNLSHRNRVTFLANDLTKAKRAFEKLHQRYTDLQHERNDFYSSLVESCDVETINKVTGLILQKRAKRNNANSICRVPSSTALRVSQTLTEEESVSTTRSTPIDPGD